MLNSETMTLGEKFLNSLGITILGMLIVFIVLIIIALSLELLRIMFGEKDKKKDAKDQEGLKIVNTNENTIQNNSQIEEAAEDIELIVLLTAAIAAQSNSSTDEIFVKSIKPVLQKSSIWASAGRQDQMLGRI